MKTSIDKNNRVRVEFEPTLDYGALKNLENTTVSSFLDLVKKVILVDGMPFGEVTYKDANDKVKRIKLTNGRKSDFLRLIESYAIVEFIGIKCHIVKVFDDSDRGKVGEFLVQRRIDKMKHS